jgi:hypothetical protein
MPTDGDGAIGALDYTEQERRDLAKKSINWVCDRCGSANRTALPETTPEEKSLFQENQMKEPMVRFSHEVKKEEAEKKPEPEKIEIDDKKEENEQIEEKPKEPEKETPLPPSGQNQIRERKNLAIKHELPAIPTQQLGPRPKEVSALDVLICVLVFIILGLLMKKFL